ncbi:hypothetical protein GLAREA_00649 [Glarea lozoyensis ATCC 20868]|uniref:Uncharacterized protein n=2 Tax=Glarea lozoyensis TaxID=101852 RepID=S3CX27_GLAL2|nr:uncharacterized protein GLAREA_00649 [Glarea lozoyensis ATCC 20868]EHL03712.1 hypothetical protein M7I_0359 [Glarea lozoyensis 74030]EPE29489.1 hypothetical protein GLAREA_00649 [Glarea lozoyensis ATCC 20868]
MPNFLPNHRLLARAFQRTPQTTRPLATTPALGKWTGRPAEEHVAREQDSNNVQIDAVKEGKQERAKGSSGNTRAANEGSGGENKKAKEDFPEAPDTIGMQDERGGKGR